MKKIQDTAALLFIAAVAVLSVLSIMGVWDFLQKNVITKSFETLGLLAFAAIIVIVAGHFIERNVAGAVAEMPNPLFRELRKTTIGIVITAVSVLALLGVLAIWDVIANKDVLNKSFVSLIIVAFSAFVVVLMCLEREGGMGEHGENKMSAGGIVAIIIGLVVLLPILFSLGGAFLFR